MSTINYTRAQLMDALFGLTKTTWEANTSGLELHFENQDEARPNPPAMFARAELAHAFSDIVSLGAPGHGVRMNRRFGSLIIQIFVPSGTGVFEAGEVADAMALAFESATFNGGLRIEGASINEIGSDGTYWQLNVLVEFQYDRVN